MDNTIDEETLAVRPSSCPTTRKVSSKLPVEIFNVKKKELQGGTKGMIGVI